MWGIHMQTSTHIRKNFLVIRVAQLSRNKCTATREHLTAGQMHCGSGVQVGGVPVTQQQKAQSHDLWALPLKDSVTLINGLERSHHFKPLLRSHSSYWLLRKQMFLP